MLNPLTQPHAPPMQAWLAPHRMPHPPQLAGSPYGLTQVVPHQILPPGHRHMPASQIWFPGQALVQLPQWEALFIGSTHVPLQAICPSTGQTHLPPEQT